MAKSKDKSKSTKSSKSSKSSKTHTGTVSTEPEVEFYNGSSDFYFPNGDKYSGQYCAHVSGVLWKEGFGTYRSKDGHVYEGNWKDDKLIEDSNLKITFADVATFHGKLVKNKYTGPGTYAMKGKMNIVSEFLDNKPVGNIIMLDPEGKPWYGVAAEESAIVYPENVLFTNISETRGMGMSRYKSAQRKSTVLETEAMDLKKATVSFLRLEKEIFAKTNKLPLNLGFEDSEWYQRYLNFKKQQQIIMYKVKKSGVTNLTKEEYLWYNGYVAFKERVNKILQNHKFKTKENADSSLLKTLNSDEYRSTKPEMVMYPSEDVVKKLEEMKAADELIEKKIDEAINNNIDISDTLQSSEGTNVNEVD